MPDPIARFRSWHRAAARAGAPIPEAMVLATADSRGRPSARYVLLKEASARGFVFYTNDDSRKGDEMRANPRAALVFYWDVTGKQVRIEGKVSVLPAREADQYWQERPAGSRIASAASEQSRTIASRALLLQRYAALEREFPGGNVPRPAHWKGYVVVPDAIEFWTRAEPRLHKRELFTRRAPSAPWKSQILQP
ncbi:MAG: pyridoxamine 5'-phosphate oxidase [Candidatus Binatia bacterium]